MNAVNTCPGCVADPHREHPHVYVAGVPIDKELAPLIGMLWALGIGTSESCQADHADYYGVQVAMIGFDTFDDAHRFVCLMAAANPVYADEFTCLSDDPGEEGFRISVWYQGRVTPGRALLSPSVAVEFPTAKITELTEGIRAHLRVKLDLDEQLPLWQERRFVEQP